MRGDGGAGSQDRGQEAPAGPVGGHGIGETARQAIAIDWSGRADRAAQRRAIWTATARDGAMTSLATGRDRREAIDAALGAIADEPATILGLDFAFSWPRWYLDANGLDDAEAAWGHAAGLSGVASRDLPAPFWGAGVRRLADAGLAGREPLRVTETAPQAVAAGARSTFHAGGNGTVGLQSIRGMPFLPDLRRAGVAVWPFDAPAAGQPVAAEIFPRMIARGAAGPAAGRGAAFRALALARLPQAAFAAVPGARGAALANQDAFDAAVSAIVLSRDARAGLVAPPGGVVDREGWIWGARLA